MSASMAVDSTPNEQKPADTPPAFPLYSWRSRSSSPNEIYFTNPRQADELLHHLPHGPIGFDLEWKPNYRKGQPQNPVAVVQLAAADTVILLQIITMRSFPAKLIQVLAGVEWTKIGVGIRGKSPPAHDCEKLYKDYGVSVHNCVDLSLMARSVDNARWKGPYTNSIGLAKLLETYDMCTLPKGRVQRSNWELRLSPAQKHYAANDAHAAYTIYSRLHEIASTMRPAPLSTYYSFSCIRGALFDCLGYLPWTPHNPDYDPGPPPPKKEPKKKDSLQEDQKQLESDITISTPTSSSASQTHSTLIPISGQISTSSVPSTAGMLQHLSPFATSATQNSIRPGDHQDPRSLPRP
ncbi:hypothetical protein ID866_6377 [Astraeus odoratus]|nr:hypothetical protein ID866_6377 [Astraeus odoratus]